MATSGSQEAICRLVEDRTIELNTEAAREPDYNGVVVTEDMLLVIDDKARNLQLYKRLDGKLMSTSHILEHIPMGVCLIRKTEVAVCLRNSTIVILSFKSIDDVKLVNTFNVSTEFYDCDSVAKLNLNKLVVSGVKWDNTLHWCVVNLTDGRVDSTHKVCKVGCGSDSQLAIKNDTVFISCWTSDSTVRGVYAYDIFNPHTPKFLYQHRGFMPYSIMVDERNFIFVWDINSNRFYQLTDSGQLVTIHTVSSRPSGIFYDDQHGVLYTTSMKSNVITLYRLDYSHQTAVPIEILNMDHRSIQLFEEALKDGKETVYNIRIMVVGHRGAGKTTLVKRLLGQEVQISERTSTDGIDVSVNCCDVSLSTHEWTRRTKDSEQDYKLQRLVKVLNENCQRRDSVADSEEGPNSKQRERTNTNHMNHNVDEDKNTEVLYHLSQEQNFDQILSSTSSQREESPSTAVATLHGSELEENVATESHKTDQLREMLKLLQLNPINAKQDVSRYAYLTILDFAAQYAFYTTHQMLMTRRAIYLLVSDASNGISDFVEDECYFDIQGTMMCKVHDLVEVWMNSIHSCAPPDKENLNSASFNAFSYTVVPPPVILVGTHIDQIPQKKLSMVANVGHLVRRFAFSGSSNPGPGNLTQTQRDYCRKRGQRNLKEIRSYLRDKPTVVHLVDQDFAIDNTVFDSKLEELKKKIVEVASQQPYWGEQIPTRWFLLEQQLLRLRDTGVKVISRIAVENLNKQGTVQIKESEELDVFLKYLHETGTIMYFSIEVLRDNIVLDPKWMIDALKSLINAQPSLPSNTADNSAYSVGPTDSNAFSAVAQKWLDFKEKGILTLELVDAVWTKEKYPQLHAHRDHILLIMEQLNIIAKPRAFSEIGEKVENYFLTPCMLRQDTPREFISPGQDPQMVSTPVLCWDFTGKFLPPPIFHRLVAACIARWPVAKKKGTSENLIFCGCCVFELGLFHRLTLHCRNHIVFARITRMVIDEVKTPDARLCSRVRKFITHNLSKITSCFGQNLQYELCTRWSPFQANSEDGLPPPFHMWFVDEGPDSDAPITPEQMNYARLCVAIVTVCGNALRDILLTQVPAPHTDIYQAILANRINLTSRRHFRPGHLQTSFLNQDQIQLVFPGTPGQKTGTVDHFDLSLLYILIREISTVPAPVTGWGNDPQDQPRDTSLGANVERINSYRNHIIGHSLDGKFSQQDFEDYWNKLEAVIHDIEAVTGRQLYSPVLENHKIQVISIHEAKITKYEQQKNEDSLWQQHKMQLKESTGFEKDQREETQGYVYTPTTQEDEGQDIAYKLSSQREKGQDIVDTYVNQQEKDLQVEEEFLEAMRSNVNNVEGMISKKMIPKQSTMIVAIRRDGYSTGVRKILFEMSKLLKREISDAVGVWCGYRPDDPHLPVFVVTFKTDKCILKKEEIPKPFFDYEIITRYKYVPNDEEISLIKLYGSTSVRTEDVAHVNNCIATHTEHLMREHNNLSIIRPCHIKSYGYMRRKMKVKMDTCIVFYVPVKGIIPIGENHFPKIIDGIVTDVREGEFVLFGDHNAMDYHQKLRIGCVISNGVCNGTLGGFVDLPDGKVGCLTAAHVVLTKEQIEQHIRMGSEAKTELNDNFAEGKEQIQMYQPHPELSNQPFGKVQTIALDEGNRDNPSVDAVLIQITDDERKPETGSFPDNNNRTHGLTSEDPLFYTSGEILNEAETRQKEYLVIKFGCSTGLTFGTLKSIECSARPVEVWGNYCFPVMYKQLEVSNLDHDFAAQGDSGALVFVCVSKNIRNLRAVGMVIGENSTRCSCLITPINTVLDKLGLTNSRFKVFPSRQMSQFTERFNAQRQAHAEQMHYTNRLLEKIESIEKKVAKVDILEQKVTSLSDKIDFIEQKTSRVDALDQKVNSLEESMNDGFSKTSNNISEGFNRLEHLLNQMSSSH